MTRVHFFEAKGKMLQFASGMSIEECWFVANNLDGAKHGFEFDQLCALAKIWSSSKNYSCAYDGKLMESIQELSKNMHVL